MSYKKLFNLLAILVVASMILAACGGTPANTSHESEPPAAVVFQKGDSVTFRYILDQTDWVKVTYLGDGEWTCESNYGDGTSTCMSPVEGTINFFWGVEKIGTTDVNHPGELTPTPKWNSSKG